MSRRIEAAAWEALRNRRKALLGLRHDQLEGEGEWLEGEREPDPVDRASAQTGADYLAALSQAELRELTAVHRAMRRLEEGTYGWCEECGAGIESRRLEAVPWALKCFNCANDAEHPEAAR